jgi:hypothetical protein
MNSTKMIRNTTAHRVKPPNTPSYMRVTPFNGVRSGYADAQYEAPEYPPVNGTSRMNSTKMIKNTTAHRVKGPKHPPSYIRYHLPRTKSQCSVWRTTIGATACVMDNICPFSPRNQVTWTFGSGDRRDAQCMGNDRARIDKPAVNRSWYNCIRT